MPRLRSAGGCRELAASPPVAAGACLGWQGSNDGLVPGPSSSPSASLPAPSASMSPAAPSMSPDGTATEPSQPDLPPLVERLVSRAVGVSFAYPTGWTDLGFDDATMSVGVRLERSNFTVGFVPALRRPTDGGPHGRPSDTSVAAGNAWPARPVVPARTSHRGDSPSCDRVRRGHGEPLAAFASRRRERRSTAGSASLVGRFATYRGLCLISRPPGGHPPGSRRTTGSFRATCPAP